MPVDLLCAQDSHETRQIGDIQSSAEERNHDVRNSNVTDASKAAFTGLPSKYLSSKKRAVVVPMLTALTISISHQL